MAQTIKRMAVGNHLSFVAEGTVVDGITVSKFARPDLDPITNWDKLGCVEDLDGTRDIETEDVYCPVQGTYELDDEFIIKADLTITSTINQLSNFFFQLFFNTKDIPKAGTPYKPNSGKGSVKGWVRIEQYDQDDEKFNDLYMWVSFSIDGSSSFSRNITKYPLRKRVLSSALNSGELLTLPIT